MFASDRWTLVERYVDLLATDGVDRGLIGPREVPRLWERHVLNCAVLRDRIPDEAQSVVDIGSGAGLPGLVVALARADLEVTLVEPLLRRTAFLDEVVAELGLGNVTVRRARAEELHGTAVFDVVTSRAVAPLPRLLAWSMPLVAPRGRLLAMKGSRAQAEVMDAAADVRRWQLGTPTVVTVGAEVVDPPTTVLEVAWAAPARIGWPLRPFPDGTTRGSGPRRRGSHERRGRPG